MNWGGRPDSNRYLLGSQPSALPVKLRPPSGFNWLRASGSNRACSSLTAKRHRLDGLPTIKLATPDGFEPPQPVLETGALPVERKGQKKLVRVVGIEPTASSFQVRPSAGDITPCKTGPWRWICTNDLAIIGRVLCLSELAKERLAGAVRVERTPASFKGSCSTH